MSDKQEREETRKLYEMLCDKHLVVIREMRELIDAYCGSKDEVHSRMVGATLLPKQEQFVELCRDKNKAGRVFGILLLEHLTSSGWEVTGQGKNGKIYRRS